MADTDGPARALRGRLNDLLQGDVLTRGTEVDDVYLGHGLLVVRLRQPKVIEGQWADVTGRTIDMTDLMIMHANDES